MHAALAVLCSASRLASFSAPQQVEPDTSLRTQSTTVDTAGQGCPAKSTHKNQTSIQGGKILVQEVRPFDPSSGMDDDYCCGFTASIMNEGYSAYYTSVKWHKAPHNKFPGQYYYICTMYEGDGFSEPAFVPGNDSTSAGLALSNHPIPEDPKCTQKTTLSQCLQESTGPTRPSKTTPCAWWDGACHYDPPMHCSGFFQPAFSNTSLYPSCINFILADHAFPTGPKGIAPGPFNWSSGTLTPGENAVVMPAQILKVGDNNWWSVDSGYTQNNVTGAYEKHPYKVCASYNQIPYATPSTGFTGCLSGGTLQTFSASRGTSGDMDSYVVFGTTVLPYAKAKVWWASYIFWSNVTDDSEVAR